MKKREQGVLSVEASLVLTLTLMCILFLLSFGRAYRAQNLVSHATLQSVDAVALESYLRETALESDISEIVDLSSYIMESDAISAESLESLRSADLPKIARQKFMAAIAPSEAEADEILKNVGVKGGLAGVDFSGSKMDLDNDDVILSVRYTLNVQFPIFGLKEMPVTKVVKAKTFGEILFGVEVVPEDPIKGSASGGGNFQHGTQIEISATPSYGYKFKMWDDGNTDNPRTVTVTGAKKYVAMFEQCAFGVNLVSSPEIGGSGSGGGEYKYLDSAAITATPSPGYHFKKWSIYKHKDKTTSASNDQTTKLTVDQSYTCTAYFEKSSYTVKVETAGTTSVNAYILYGNTNQTSVKAPYQSSFKLVAPSVSGYRFVGWKEKGSSSYFSTSATMPMTIPAKDTTYVAYYESTLRTVKFYNYDGSLYETRQVYAGNALGSQMPANPYYTGYRFNGWKGFHSGTIVYNDTSVYGNWAYCTSHTWGHCGVKHSLGGTYWWPLTNSHQWKGHNVSWASCTRCVYCKKRGSYRVLCGTHWEKLGPSGWWGYAYVGANDCGSYNLP